MPLHVYVILLSGDPMHGARIHDNISRCPPTYSEGNICEVGGDGGDHGGVYCGIGALVPGGPVNRTYALNSVNP
jgi:hypothetical protein